MNKNHNVIEFPQTHKQKKNSAKSRVRGTLDIYHAFVRDLDDHSENVTPPDSPTPPETATPPEWDIVNMTASVSFNI